eukprot:7068207-Ditylum_brightwellii.AAC.1
MDRLVCAAIGQTASVMEYASKNQFIEFIELAVMGSGQKWEHHRIGGFSTYGWKHLWAKEVFKAIGKK